MLVRKPALRLCFLPFAQRNVLSFGGFFKDRMGERSVRIREVKGSNPSRSIKNKTSCRVPAGRFVFYADLERIRRRAASRSWQGSQPVGMSTGDAVCFSRRRFWNSESSELPSGIQTHPPREGRYRAIIGECQKSPLRSAAEPQLPITSAPIIYSCSDTPLGTKIIFYPMHIRWMNRNIPQGMRCCTGRHRRIQWKRKQRRPHLKGNLVFHHKDPQTLQPLGGVQGVKFDPLLFSLQNRFQKIHRRSFPVPKRRRAACFHKFCSASLRLALML